MSNTKSQATAKESQKVFSGANETSQESNQLEDTINNADTKMDRIGAMCDYLADEKVCLNDDEFIGLLNKYDIGEVDVISMYLLMNIVASNYSKKSKMEFMRLYLDKSEDIESSYIMKVFFACLSKEVLSRKEFTKLIKELKVNKKDLLTMNKLFGSVADIVKLMS